jgi:uncharacterized protein YegJ (DUF2314 family)
MRIFCHWAVALVIGAGVIKPAAADDIADNFTEVARDNTDMKDAFQKAKATLPAFLALAHKPRSSITSMAVKVGITDEEGTEYFWINPFHEENGRLVGTIDNTPRMVRNVKLGQIISFKQSDVVDWLYRENGRMVGNYTACALIKRETPSRIEAFKMRYGLTCKQ